MSERRWLAAVEADRFDRPGFDVAQDFQTAVKVADFVQAVIDGLADNRLIGNGDVADDVFLASSLRGEHRCQQVFGAHAVEVRRKAVARARSAGADRTRRSAT